MLIHVLGAPGSGVSTLAAGLASLYGCPVLEADDYHWHLTEPPYVHSRSKVEKSHLLQRNLCIGLGQIIAGSLSHWADDLAPIVAACILLTCSSPIRIERIRARERQRFGARIEHGGDMYQRHMDFVAWAAEYDSRSPEHDRSLRTDKLWVEKVHCPVLIVETSIANGKQVENSAADFLAAEGLTPARGCVP